MSNTHSTPTHCTLIVAEKAVGDLKESTAELRPVERPASAINDISFYVWLHLRTRELAMIAGRSPDDVTERDFEHAFGEAICGSLRERQRVDT